MNPIQAEKYYPTTGQVHLTEGQVRVKQGDRLPAIVLHSTAGRDVDLLAEALKQHLILFFYPGDFTGRRFTELAGCTNEARSFRDHLDKIRDLGATVFGVNLYTTERQKEFVLREKLTFELLSDHSKKLTDALGVPLWVSHTGEEFVSRNTIIVEKGGTVSFVFENVEPEGHAEHVIQNLKQKLN